MTTTQNRETNKQTKKRTRGRPSIFDRDKLIQEVTQLFWTSGYKALSFNEISQETGLTRASLYNAFGSKEALLMEALDVYFAQAPDTALQHIKKGELVGPVFFKVFKVGCQRWASDEKRRGCFGVNCLNELMNSQSELGDSFKAMYEEKRLFVVSLIKRAIIQEELPINTNAEATGNMILAFMSGFSTFSKSGISEELLQEMCRAFLENIGFQLTPNK